MSIALQTIHANPIVTQKLIIAESLTQWLPQGEFVISIEADTIEEMSRLWQAFTVPMRLSALIRVGVVFIAPVDAISPPNIPPSTTNISIEPEPIEPPPPMPSDPPSLIGGHGIHVPPLPPNADPAAVTQTVGPLIAVGGNPAIVAAHPEQALGSTLILLGNSLMTPAAASLFLGLPGTATDWDITSWIAKRSAGEIDIVLPASYAPPGDTAPFPATLTPVPGIYTIAVGSGATRSNTIQLAIAPRVDGVTNPPTLSPNSSGVFMLTGAGFQPNANTAITLGGTALTFSGAAAPSAGQFTVDAAGANIAFVPPTALPAGNYPVLLAVNGIAATTGWVAAVS
jgi:Pvc16 N-terminal domain